MENDVKKYAMILASASAMMLAGCASLNDAYQNVVGDNMAAPQNYKAIGQEPGWTLEITPNAVEYVGDYGEKRISANSKSVRLNGESLIYANGRLVLNRTAETCSDTMSGQRYRETVRLVVDGQRLQGCGGGTMALETLNDSNWTLLSVNGKDALPNVEANLAFADGRISGTAGCNRLMGGYSQNGDTLDFTEIASTRMACPAPNMEQEHAVSDVLKKGVKVHHLEDGTMELRAPDGKMLRLRQIF